MQQTADPTKYFKDYYASANPTNPDGWKNVHIAYNGNYHSYKSRITILPDIYIKPLIDQSIFVNELPSKDNKNIYGEIAYKDRISYIYLRITYIINEAGYFQRKL